MIILCRSFLKRFYTKLKWVLNFGQVGGPNKKIQKHPLGSIFLNRPKSRKKYKGFPCKMKPDQIYSEFSCNRRSFLKRVLLYNKADKCCPLPYSLPSGPVLTLRRGRSPSCADGRAGRIER